MISAIAAVILAQQRPEPDWLPVLDAPARLSHGLTIPSPVQAGPPLEVRGTVFRPDGKTPAPGVILYFHHTDATGVYPRPAGATDWRRWHGTLRGWLKTDANGRYQLRTTRPGAYPDGTEPAHIHAYGLAPGSRTGFYFRDILFHGDRLITPAYWERVARFGTKPYAGMRLTRDATGLLRGQWNFTLPD